MHRTNEPAESDVMVQGLQTAPCFSSRGNTDQRKQNSSHKLQHKYCQRSAAKDVPPAGGISRHGMFGHLANRRRKLKAVVKPVSQFRNNSHVLSLGSEAILGFLATPRRSQYSPIVFVPRRVVVR